jgi:hypothetical protein
MRAVFLSSSRFLLAIGSLTTGIVVSGTLLTVNAAEPGLPTVQAAPPARLLVVTVTNGFRHGSILTAEPVLEALGRSSGLFHVDFLRVPSPPKPISRAADTSDEAWKKQEEKFTTDKDTFRTEEESWKKSPVNEQFARAFAPQSLATFDGVIFANTTGNLPIPDMAAFLDWVRSGKAFIGMHSATDTLNGSDDYRALIGGIFAGHPWNAGGEHAFVVHEPTHPLARMFAERFRWNDEIYQYDPRFDPTTVRVLLSLDMAASNPKQPWHVPVSWLSNFGKGRVFYTNLGHNDATWQNETFQQHIQLGIGWSLGRFDVPADPNPEVQAAEYLRSVIAVAAPATGNNADDYRAKADAKIAADPQWSVRLRPLLVELRGMAPPARAEGYAKVLAEILAP